MNLFGQHSWQGTCYGKAMNQNRSLILLQEKKTDTYNKYIMSSKNNESMATTTPSAPQLKQRCSAHIYSFHINYLPHFMEPVKYR